MLAEALNAYLALRRAGGFKYRGQEVLLRSFVRFASSREESYIRTQTAIDWATLGASPEQRENRLRTVIDFARHCRAEHPQHEVPPAGVFGAPRQRRPVAYIFSAEEICRLLDAARALPPTASLRPYTYYTLIGLLAATGMRIGEALRLHLDDVTADGLFIRESKFHKSRLVPLHETAERALRRYLALRHRIGGGSEHLFVGHYGRPLTISASYQTFQELLRTAGMGSARRGRAPRLHDFRHTWACRALETSPAGADRVDLHTRAVFTYLGHVNVATGFWYLHATPVLMQRIADACAAHEQEEPT